MSSLLAGLRKWQVKKSWKVEGLRVTYRDAAKLEAIACVFIDAGLVLGDEGTSWDQALLQHARCKGQLPVTIARDNIGRLIGAAVGTAAGQVFEVEEIAVLRESRSQGVGTDLLRSLESLSKVGGAHTCHAFVPEDDLESQLFFKAAGYAVPGKRSGIVEVDGATSYLFVRSLGEPDDFAELDDGD